MEFFSATPALIDIQYWSEAMAEAIEKWLNVVFGEMTEQERKTYGEEKDSQEKIAFR